MQTGMNAHAASAHCTLNAFLMNLLYAYGSFVLGSTKVHMRSTKLANVINPRYECSIVRCITRSSLSVGLHPRERITCSKQFD